MPQPTQTLVQAGVSDSMQTSSLLAERNKSGIAPYGG